MTMATTLLQWSWSSPNKGLLEAASGGDLRAIQKCLHSGAEVNYRGMFGETALHRAIQKRHYGIVKELLNIPGADLNIGDFCNDTPLIQACRAKSFVLAKTLLRVGADKELPGWCGQKAIDIAQANESVDIIELFQAHDIHGDDHLDHTLTIDEEYEELKHLMSQHDQNEENIPPSKLEKMVLNTKAKMRDYYEHFCEMMDKYLQVLSEGPSWKQLQQITSLWNRKHDRPQLTGIAVTDTDGAEVITEEEEKTKIKEGYLAIMQRPDKTEDGEQDRGASITCEKLSNEDISHRQPVATMTAEEFEIFQQDIYSAKEIKKYVYETYLNAAEELCISIIEGHKELVEKYVRKKHETIPIIFLEQPDFNKALFLAGGDFVEKPAIGPGSCIAAVDDSFLTDEINNLKFSDVITGQNIGQDLSWGTLGCFATVSEEGGDELYSLSAKHVINRKNSQEGNDANVKTGIAAKKDVDCFPENKLKESFPMSFQHTLHVSKSYFGIQGEILPAQNGDEEVYVDVVMLGPIFKTLLEKHKPFSPLYEIKIATGFLDACVKKFGAATGLTTGKIICVMETLGLLIVANHVAQETGDNMANVPKPFAKPGDSGAILLLDESPELQGIGIVHRILPHYTVGRENRVRYENPVVCVRLDYSAEALQSKFKKFREFNNRVRLYLSHLHPKLDVHL